MPDPALRSSQYKSFSYRDLRTTNRRRRARGCFSLRPLFGTLRAKAPIECPLLTLDRGRRLSLFWRNAPKFYGAVALATEFSLS